MSTSRGALRGLRSHALEIGVPGKHLHNCPICGKKTEPARKAYPFCSDRCKTIDLGNWASETYVTHSPLTEADEKNDPTERLSQDD